MKTVTKGADTYTVADTPGADWGFWEQYADGRWEPSTFQVLDRFLHPDDIYFDIGAWVGPTVLYAASRCRTVIALEPDPVALECLHVNIQANALGNVTVLPAALAPWTGGATLFPRDGWGSSMSSLIGSGDGLEVATYSIDDLIRGFGRPGLVKMDIEGGEAIVLPEVAARCVEMACPLLVSLHAPWWPAGADGPVRAALELFGRATTVEQIGGFSTVLGEP